MSSTFLEWSEHDIAKGLGSQGEWEDPPLLGERGARQGAAASGTQLRGLESESADAEAVRRLVGSFVESHVRQLRTADDGLITRLLEAQADLAERVAVLEQGLHDRPRCRSATIYDLNDDGVELLQPLQLVIEEYSDEVLATWPEVGAIGSGVSEVAAILALKQDLVDLAGELLSFEDDELGKLPLSQKRAIERVVKRRGGT